MLRGSISKVLNLFKNDVVIQLDLNKFHSTLSKMPFIVLNRKMNAFNLNMFKNYSHSTESAEHETELEIIDRYIKLFDDCEIDGWWLRKHMTDITGMDMIPHPIIIQAALRACRRINDYALGVRFMEAVKFKCGGNAATYRWIIDQVKVVFLELGMDSPEDLCYNKPELFLDSTTTPFLDGPTRPPKLKYEVPVSRKPPPPCTKPVGKSNIEGFDTASKPPPPCMKAQEICPPPQAPEVCPPPPQAQEICIPPKPPQDACDEPKSKKCDLDEKKKPESS